MPESGGGGSATGNPFLDLLIVAALIVCSGFFAASEFSLITVKRHRLAQLSSEGNHGARAAERLLEDPSRFLATIQVALTFLGFLASAVGAVSFSGAMASHGARCTRSGIPPRGSKVLYPALDQHRKDFQATERWGASRRILRARRRT